MATRRARKFWLLPFVGATHLAVGIGLYASGIWNLERVESGHRFGEIGVMMPPPPPGGGSPPAAARRAIEPKRVLPKVLTQPVPNAKPDPLAGMLSGTTEGKSTGTGTGTGTGSGDGACMLPPCGDLPGVPGGFGTGENLKVPEVPTLTPTEIASRRISGDTQIEPVLDDKHDMRDSGKRVVSGTFAINVSATGAVTGVQVLKGTGYATYDERLVAAMYQWKYRPYSIDGTAQPFRGTIRFDYKLGTRN